MHFQLVCTKAVTPLQCLFLNNSTPDKKPLKWKVSTWKSRAMISAVKEQHGQNDKAFVTSDSSEKCVVFFPPRAVYVCFLSMGKVGNILMQWDDRKVIKKSGKQQHHLWQKRDSACSGQKALDLVQIISSLPDEKEAMYGGLDKWIAWETEFPLIAAAKALRISAKRDQWS